MPREFLALSFGFAALIALTQQGHAEGAPCGTRAAIVDQLGTRYHETRRAIGIASNTMVLELFASDDSGSFTILATLPDGRSCMIASGENFEAVTEPLPAAGKGL